MKNIRLFITFFVCLNAVNLTAQLNRSLPPVTLNMQQVPIQEIFAELEKQTGMFFSYESSLLKDLPKVSLKVEETSFSHCLKLLFDKLPLVYRITGQYVILKPKPVRYTISGFVRDYETFESFINATVYEGKSGKGVVTNSYGFYSLTLPPGQVRIISSYVGFEMEEIRFDLQKDTLLEITLNRKGYLKEIVVNSSDPNSPIASSRMGNIELSSETFRRNPALFSEPDPLKTLHLIPGISFGTDGFTGLYVRGGGGDDNLFLIDGIPIYNTGHLGGLFSTFNPDVIKHVDFYKGGFPARYGGRLSSVMDVRLKDGDKQQYHGNISFGLISAKAQLEGPLIKDRTSFNVAFRRTWLDAVTTPAFAIINRNSTQKAFVGYSFYDLNAKVNHTVNDRSRFYLNFYMGQDRFKTEEWEMENGEEDNGNKYIWRWGNLLSALNWTYVFSNKLFANLNVAYTRYRSSMRDEYVQRWSYYYQNNDELNYDGQRETNDSGIQDIGYKFDFDYSLHPNHYIRFGSEYQFHTYNPEKHIVEYGLRNEGEWTYQVYNFVNSRVYAHEFGFFGEDDWRLNRKWKLNIGARIGTYHVEKRSYISFQPRLSLRYLIRQDLSLKASYVKMNQYAHRLSNVFLDIPSAIWVPVTASIKPMFSHLVSAGAYYNHQDMFDLSTEIYFKKMDNLIDYKDQASLFPQYVNWDDKISVGSGRAYGIETMINKKAGKTTGWIAYTLSWTDRKFDDRTVNEGKSFPARHDNRHKLNIVAAHQFNKKFDMSASWVYASGNRATVATDYYLSPDSERGMEGGWPQTEAIYRKNALKMRNYHRMDLSFNFYRPKKNGRMGIWNISFYNLYSRMNTFYVKEITRESSDKLLIKEVGIIPIIPSFSYTYKF